MSEFERGEIRPDPFQKACEFGLEGLISKRRDTLTKPNSLLTCPCGQVTATTSTTL
jgi:hypothetical protein